MKYGFSKIVNMSYDDAVEKVTSELKKEGFGVLTSIDVKDTLKKKIDIDFKKYIILGACNPSLAHKGLQAEEELGLLLPCNVLVYEREGDTVVSVFNPMIMTEIIQNNNLTSMAAEVKEKLERVLEAL
ncbi:MAG: DUF302 domain-containing protein [Ignavibacteriales bacterium]|nr:MAG: DUF302 domain-containing protein [Ignavibacteriales bacterium]